MTASINNTARLVCNLADDGIAYLAVHQAQLLSRCRIVSEEANGVRKINATVSSVKNININTYNTYEWAGRAMTNDHYLGIKPSAFRLH